MRRYFINKKLKILFLSLTLGLSISTQRAYAFWGDGGAGWAQIPYLVKILTENYKRYKQIKMMIDQAKDRKNFLKTINSGLNNSIGLLESIPVKDEKILAELKSFKKSMDTIQDVYGKVPKSKEALLHTLHDQTVAESLRMVNSFKSFTKKQEENSLLLSIQSRSASPKGAARMQVEASSKILKSLNQLITLNGQMLKMQSEILAVNNKGKKENVANYNKINGSFRKSFKDLNLNMKLARY